MDNQQPKTIVALSPGELAKMYIVSLRTLRAWLKPHAAVIGTRTARTYTPLQVEKIFSCIGLPAKNIYQNDWNAS